MRPNRTGINYLDNLTVSCVRTYVRTTVMGLLLAAPPRAGASCQRLPAGRRDLAPANGTFVRTARPLWQTLWRTVSRHSLLTTAIGHSLHSPALCALRGVLCAVLCCVRGRLPQRSSGCLLRSWTGSSPPAPRRPHQLKMRRQRRRTLSSNDAPSSESIICIES